MAQFEIAVTEAGKALLAASIGGQAVTFSSMGLGDGIYTGDFSGMEAMISPKFSLGIGSVTRIGNRVEIRAVLTMEQLEEPFHWRELGVFTSTPDGDEVLAIYGNAGEKGDYLTNVDGILDEREIVLSILVGQDEVVTDLSGVLFASKAEMDAHKADIRVHTSPNQKIYPLTHVKSGTVHQLSGLPGVTGIVSAVFTAAAAYAAGDTFTVDGAPYAIQLSNGEAAEDNLFVSGASVPVVVDTVGKKVNFKSAGGAKLPADTMAIVKIYMKNDTFVVPQTAQYRITAIAQGGYGESASYQDYSGGGGGAGGACQLLAKLRKGDSYAITAGSKNASFGSLCSAVMGQDANENVGGIAGTSSGGTNLQGVNGSTATTSSTGSGGRGGGYDAALSVFFSQKSTN